MIWRLTVQNLFKMYIFYKILLNYITSNLTMEHEEKPILL